MTKPIVVFGAGDIAELAAYYFEHDAGRRVAAFTVDSAYLKEPVFAGRPVVPFEEIERSHPAADHDFFVGTSYAKRNSVREQKCAEAMAKGYALQSYVSSRASVFDTRFGWNCFILEDNTVQPFVKVGNNVTMWSGNHIGHHSTIEDNCFITSHVVISGGVRVGRNAFVGVNTTVRDHVEIGDRCIIGAGSLILHSTAPGTVYIAAETLPSQKPA